MGDGFSRLVSGKVSYPNHMVETSPSHRQGGNHTLKRAKRADRTQG
jgi:hypothetical protein